MIAPASQPTPPDIDVELMLRVQQDDVQAFHELFERHHPRVLRLISCRMGNSIHSEDLAQQVFMLIFRARYSYTPSAKFTTWLYAIIRNVVLNTQRQLRRRQELLSRSQQLQYSAFERGGSSTQVGPMECAVQREARRSVLIAVQQLGEKQQQAVRLVYLRGYSYHAAASSMGVTVSSVKQLLHRAKNKLRHKLETD